MAPDRATDQEFLAACRQAVASSGADRALTELGWWDLLAHLDDREARLAVFAFFRAQGGGLGSSTALGGLIAQPHLADAGLTAGSAVAGIVRRTRRGGGVVVVVGDPAGRLVLIDQPGRGVSVTDPDQLDLRPVEVAGRLPLYEVGVDPATLPVTIPERPAASRLAGYLGRVAIAAEILGCAERDLEIATNHAASRAQFGRPIGTFQAVRHLLAWSLTDITAIDAVLHQAIRLGPSAPPLFGEVVKALAGRNGRRPCERSLQVLGGIGFTAEHDHHHFHSRVLSLDGMLGSSAELTRQLGSELRATGDPGFPSAVLLATATP